MTEDVALYEAWAEGDRDAGERLVARHLATIARFFANKVAHVDDRADLVSKTFEIVSRKLGDYRRDGSVRAYLFGIASNVLRDYLKALRRRPAAQSMDEMSLADLTRSPSVRAAEAEHRQLLLVALRSVPLQTQIVLELSLFEELGRAEIAELLAEPPGTIASRLRRGRARLEEKLRELAASDELLDRTLDSITAWRERVRAQVE